MATQERIIPGQLTVRQTGGSAGTDEIQFSHDGTDGLVESQSGDLVLKRGSAKSLTIGSSAILPDAAGSLFIGSSGTYFSGLYALQVNSPQDLDVSSGDGAVDNGFALNLNGGDAVAASNGDGGDIVLTPGSADGTGTAGIVSVAGSGELSATTLTAPTIQRGTAGNASVYTDAGANNITIGGSTSTIVVAGNLQVDGTTTTVNSTNLDVSDKNITVNNGGSTAGATEAGINIEGDASAVVGFFRSASDNGNLELKAPTGGILTLDINTNSTFTIGAGLTVSGASTIDQDVSTTGSPSFDQVSATGTGTNSITGSVVVGSPTGGSQGAGTINAEDIYIDGTSISSSVTSLDDLSDVTITTVSSGNILYYDGTNFVNEDPGATSGVQPYDSDLNTIAGLAHSDGNFIVSDGTNWTVESGATARTSLGLTIGSDVQAWDDDLDDIAALAHSDGNFIVSDGTNWVVESDATARASLGLTIGTDVQAWDDDLDDIAALAHSDGNFIVSDGTNWVVESGSTARDSLGLGASDSVTHDTLTASTSVTTPTINRGSAGTVNLFTDAGANDINIGGSTSNIVVAGDLQVDGTMTTINSTVLDVTDKNITVNDGGNTAGATEAGINIEGDTGAVVGYMRSASDNANLEFKAPTGSILTLDMDANHTINLSGASANEVIKYDGTNFVNASISTSDLTDFNLSGLSNGDVLYYDGTDFVNAAPGSTSGVQAHDDDLDDLAALTHSDGNFIVSDGTNWVVESGSTARDSLGLGTGDSPTFTGTIIGDTGSNSIAKTRVLRNTTTDGVQTELFLDGSSTRMTLADDTTWLFDIKIVARRTDSDDECAAYRVEGAIDRNTGAATTSLIGSNDESLTEDTVAWDIDVDADTTNGALRIRVTGEAGKNIKWVAFVRTVEVTG